ncbi:MAG: hypothetical protein ACJ8G3_00425 [Burkholderiaceae bacterium]
MREFLIFPPLSISVIARRRDIDAAIDIPAAGHGRLAGSIPAFTA